ncbi:putative F-box/FBD/LRR-repeat protein At5g22670 [Cornus florida]|uniref:putative F-box/FBD/LRR-repeat protein At5g22670 n=1 Tax=Cornus florida TaxID=4283 RepID=UPI00289643AC|nr:putative F-box/FBD/LRR-repeat protein At5g22670 [Cornus florida]
MNCPTFILKLGVGLSFSAVPRSVHFKSLKVLHVSIDRPNNDLAQNLFSNCPVLEDLFILGNVESDEELVFDVSVPALKNFKFLLAGEEYKVLVDAPILEYLSVQNVWMPSYVLKNVTSLIDMLIK